jgi:hypothetical protein
MKNKHIMCAVLMCLWSACADDPQPNATDMAVADQGADMRVMMDMSVVEPPKKGLGESCGATSECERSLACNPFQNICIDRGGCLLDWILDRGLEAEDEGCIITHDSSGRTSAKECEVDADCKGNPRSERCQFRICQDYADCTRDADCEAPLLCWGEDGGADLMSVCAP